VDALLHPLSFAIPALLAATELTLVLAIVCGVLAMVFAIPAGFGRVSRVTLIRSISSFYVETIRGTPLLLQLLVWYFGVRLVLLAVFNLNIDTQIYNLLTLLNSNSLFPKGGDVSSFFFGIIGLSFNYGAYLAEVIRAGILAVEHGQTEAAQSLGLSRFQTARYIVLPQALRVMLPPLTSNSITLVQDTAFLQVLGITDLSLRTQEFTEATSNIPTRWEFYVVELAIYFVICVTLSQVSRRMERRVAHTLAGAH
jgi:His/Glu/Gln/Arg/opine family amino acid ABC transporter permease subunit